MSNSQISIEQLIAQGEHQQLDFKFRIDDAAKIAKTLVAFANTDGGRLLVGVKDNGNIVGVKSDEDFYVIESAAEIYSRPVVGFEMRSWKLQGKTVLEIYIPPSARRPHQTKDETGSWKSYYRDKDKNLLANGVMVKVWELGNKRKPPTWNYSVAEQKLFETLREKGEISLTGFCKLARIRRRKAEETLARLVSWGIIKMSVTESGCRFESNQNYRD